MTEKAQNQFCVSHSPNSFDAILQIWLKSEIRRPHQPELNLEKCPDFSRNWNGSRIPIHHMPTFSFYVSQLVVLDVI